MSNAYAEWAGRSVVLQVRAAEGQVDLSGTIVGENENALRVRVGQTWDIDIFKSMILGVHDTCRLIVS